MDINFWRASAGSDGDALQPLGPKYALGDLKTVTGLGVPSSRFVAVSSSRGHVFLD